MCGRQHVKSGRDNATHFADKLAEEPSWCVVEEIPGDGTNAPTFEGQQNGLYPTLISSFLLSLNHGGNLSLMDGFQLLMSTWPVAADEQYGTVRLVPRSDPTSASTRPVNFPPCHCYSSQQDSSR